MKTKIGANKFISILLITVMTLALFAGLPTMVALAATGNATINLGALGGADADNTGVAATSSQWTYNDTTKVLRLTTANGNYTLQGTKTGLCVTVDAVDSNVKLNNVTIVAPTDQAAFTVYGNNCTVMLSGNSYLHGGAHKESFVVNTGMRCTINGSGNLWMYGGAGNITGCIGLYGSSTLNVTNTGQVSATDAACAIYTGGGNTITVGVNAILTGYGGWGIGLANGVMLNCDGQANFLGGTAYVGMSAWNGNTITLGGSGTVTVEGGSFGDGSIYTDQPILMGDNVKLRMINQSSVTETHTFKKSNASSAYRWKLTNVNLTSGTLTDASIGVSVGSNTVGLVAREIVPVTSVKITNEPDDMVIGKKHTLKATVSPQNATNKTVTWISSNPSIATVNPKTGEVIAKKPGEVTITATADGKKTICKITVHTYVSMCIGKTAAIQNGNKVKIDNTYTKTYPWKTGGRTMLPIRFISEKMGGKVTYTKDKDPIYIQYGDITMALKIGSKTMKVTQGKNSKTITLDVAATKRDSRVYLPLRAISEALGFQVKYQAISGKEYIVVNNPKMTAAVETARFAEAKNKIK